MKGLVAKEKRRKGTPRTDESVLACPERRTRGTSHRWAVGVETAQRERAGLSECRRFSAWRRLPRVPLVLKRKHPLPHEG